jgi:drug/metabolite transporter (DMT)-like permease
MDVARARRALVGGIRRDARGAVVEPVSAGGPRRDALLVLAAFAAVWFVWGSTYLAIAWAVEGVPPLLMIGVRCLLAGGVLYGWMRVRGGARPTAADWRAAALAGVLLFVTGQAVLAWAETRIDSGPAALLLATEPLFIALVAWRGGRLAGGAAAGPRPGVRTLLAMAAGFAGVGLMVVPGGGGRLDTAGALAALAASLSWSIGIFRAGRRPGLGPAQLAGMQLLTAGGVLLAVSLVSGEAAGLRVWPSARSLAAFGYLVVFGSVLTYGAYVWLLDRVGPERLSTHAYVNPAVAVGLGALLAGEPVTPVLLLAMTLILGAVVVMVRRAPAASARTEREREQDGGADGAERPHVVPERPARDVVPPRGLAFGLAGTHARQHVVQGHVAHQGHGERGDEVQYAAREEVRSGGR